MFQPECFGEALQEGALGCSVAAQQRACCLEAEVPNPFQASVLKHMLGLHCSAPGMSVACCNLVLQGRASGAHAHGPEAAEPAADPEGADRQGAVAIQ